VELPTNNKESRITPAFFCLLFPTLKVFKPKIPMKKRIVTGLTFLLVTYQLSFSQTITEPGKTPVQAISQERVAKLDAMLEGAMQREQVPGLVAMVVKDGKIVYHAAKGMADVETGKTMEKNSIFRIASQSKAITSTAVMILWEEGKFRLDDPISKYIPEFKTPQVLGSVRSGDTTYNTRPSTKESTLRPLLTHTSGLGYGVIDGGERMKMSYHKAGVTDLFTTENIKSGESVKRLAALPLHHEPGAKFTYSEGLDVLGYLIEVVSGMPFDEFLKTRLFDPLGMNDTRFYLDDSQASRLVTVHTWKEGSWASYPVTFYDPAYPKTGAKAFFSGGAGLSSTTADYAKFLQMYLNGGIYNGKRILSSQTIQTIMTN